MLAAQPQALTTLVNILLNTYFSGLNCVNIVSENETLDIHTGLKTLNYNLDENYNISKALFRFGCHGFVVYSTRPRYIFEMLEFKIRFTHSTKFHERRYLFVPSGVYKEDLFGSSRLEFVADVLVVDYAEGGYGLWTHKYVGVDGHKTPVLMDTWFAGNESFLEGVNCYPDKLSDQQGRALRINTFDYKPYINLDTRHGLELMMALEYVKMYNMSTEIITETEFWGLFFFQNLTASGAKWTLWSDQSDLSMAQWYSLEDYTIYYDLTESTVRIGVTLIVPGPELAGGWLIPLFSFPYSVWAGFLLSYFGLILAFFSFDYFYIRNILEENIKTTPIFSKSFVIVTVTLFLQQGQRIIENANAAYLRRMFTILLVTALLYAATYSAGFSAIMTIPRYTKGIETTFDFDASGVKLGGVHPALLDGFRQLPEYQNIVKNFLTLTNEEIRHRLHLGNFAMIVDRVPTGLVLGKRIDYKDLHRYRVVKDDLYRVYCIMLVKKSSILIPSIKKAFLIMKEAGLPLYWEEMAFQEENYEAIRALRYNKKETPVVKLQWRHVEGVFVFLWLGTAASSVCFIGEIVYHKKTAKETQKLRKHY